MAPLIFSLVHLPHPLPPFPIQTMCGWGGGVVELCWSLYSAGVQHCFWPDSEPTNFLYHPKTKSLEVRGPQTDKHCLGLLCRRYSFFTLHQIREETESRVQPAWADLMDCLYIVAHIWARWLDRIVQCTLYRQSWIAASISHPTALDTVLGRNFLLSESFMRQ